MVLAGLAEVLPSARSSEDDVLGTGSLAVDSADGPGEDVSAEMESVFAYVCPHEGAREVGANANHCVLIGLLNDEDDSLQLSLYMVALGHVLHG